MRLRRAGFTLIELVIVCALAGGLAMMAIPRVGTMRDTYNVQSAAQQLSATLATARAAAVQKNSSSRFHVNGSRISVVVDTSATDSIFVVRPIDLEAQFGVRLATLPDDGARVVRFESRGFASPRLSQPAMYVLQRAARSDTVCVGVLGQVLTRGCSP